MASEATKTDDGGAAFPGDEAVDYDCGKPVYAKRPGMSLRDYFAAKAMQAIIAKHPARTVPRGQSDADDAATAGGSYAYADAMLAARKAGAQ